MDIPNTLQNVVEDPDDDKIVETAVVANAEVIISGDRHLLRLKKYRNVKIVTASEFLGT